MNLKFVYFIHLHTYSKKMLHFETAHDMLVVRGEEH